MTRQEHLKFCKTCVNRKMDLKAGLLCQLTGRIADFEDECPSYQKDEKAIVAMDDEVEMVRDEITSRVSDATLEKLKSEQNLPAAIFAGIFIGVLAGFGWAAITVATGWQIGIVAIAIGAAVGFGMRFFGKGIDQIFGISGAIIALVSCIFGNLLSIIGFVAIEFDQGFFETFINFDFSYTFEILKETARPMDLFFYAIAAYEGYKFSFRKFTQKELHELERPNGSES
ncbi:hypothetical protein [Winogradskyella tangerina]|uniref:hypothetical protein n=1 Tax=Winogradskyella tangerina TaxID=2023240 RepID=UPI001E5DD0F6|nr:hypothetical protein [Winogradskyella tangerina]